MGRQKPTNRDVFFRATFRESLLARPYKVHDEKRETRDGLAFDAVGATLGTIGPPYASALEGCVAGTTTSRCTTSPSRARWSSRKDSACSECGASSTGARNTRAGDALSFSLGAAVGGGVGVVAGSESVAAARGSARSPVASRGVSLAGGSEDEAEPAIARVFGLRTFSRHNRGLECPCRPPRHDFFRRRGTFWALFPVLPLGRRSLRSARAVTTSSSKPAMPNPVATFETTEVRPGCTPEPPDSCTAGSPRLRARRFTIRSRGSVVPLRLVSEISRRSVSIVKRASP